MTDTKESVVEELRKYLRNFADAGDPRMQDGLIQRAAEELDSLRARAKWFENEVQSMTEYAATLKHDAGLQYARKVEHERDVIRARVAELESKLAEAQSLIKRHEDALMFVLYKHGEGFRVGWLESKLFVGDTPLAAIEAAKGEPK